MITKIRQRAKILQCAMYYYFNNDLITTLDAMQDAGLFDADCTRAEVVKEYNYLELWEA